MARAGLYVPLDVNFPDDDRIEEVGPAAAGIFAFALCLAKRLGSDGRVTRVKLTKLGGTSRTIGALVDVGLLTEPDDDPGALVITAWLDHNAPMAEVQLKRDEDAQRKRVARAKRPDGQPPDSERTSGPCPQESLLSRVEGSRDKTETEGSSPSSPVGSVARIPKVKTEPPGFAEWFQAYPLRIERAAAAKAYAKARKLASEEELLSGAKAYAKYQSRQPRPGDFVANNAYPSTWLNKCRWTDDFSIQQHDVNTDPAAGAW